MNVDDELTYDAFLGGQIHVWQPKRGYRAATDAVFLAAACPAIPGERVLELGCGVGVASLCLQARVAKLEITGIERQPAYAALAERNGLQRVITADLTALPGCLRGRSFDHVIMNPPYFGPGSRAADEGREIANREETPLVDWIGTARARLSPKGWLTIIHLAEALPRMLRSMDGFGSISVLPLAPRIARPAKRVILRARKGGMGGFSLLAPFIVHDGPRHASDGDDYTHEAREILRRGAALSFD